MKCQNLFSGENEKKYLKMLFAEMFTSMPYVKVRMVVADLCLTPGLIFPTGSEWHVGSGLLGKIHPSSLNNYVIRYLTLKASMQIQ